MFWECLTGSAGIKFSRLESKHCLDVVTDGLGFFFFHPDMYGSWTVCSVAPWRWTPHLSSCTVSSYMGSPTLKTQGVCMSIDTSGVGNSENLGFLSVLRYLSVPLETSCFSRGTPAFSPLVYEGLTTTLTDLSLHSAEEFWVCRFFFLLLFQIFTFQHLLPKIFPHLERHCCSQIVQAPNIPMPLFSSGLLDIFGINYAS